MLRRGAVSPYWGRCSRLPCGLAVHDSVFLGGHKRWGASRSNPAVANNLIGFFIRTKWRQDTDLDPIRSRLPLLGDEFTLHPRGDFLLWPQDRAGGQREQYPACLAGSVAQIKPSERNVFFVNQRQGE